MRVLAGPGTGKTATIAAAVAARIADGVDPQSILVLTFARRAARELATRISMVVDATTVEPIVRTLHSYCYALLRATTPAADAPPRMLGAGETDGMVRDLLAGHLADGAHGWPDHLRPALAVDEFASEVREFLLRCAERELSPAQIAALAQRHGRPEWRSMADFIAEYRDVGDLRQAAGRLGAALDQAELTAAALSRLADPAILAAEQRRVRRIFVDEYQDVDPAQARLIDLLARGADELVVVGDPDQAIYGFRGAVTGAMGSIAVDSTVALTGSRRLPAVLVEATRRVAARIPGPVAHRDITAAPDPVRSGSLEVRVLPSPAVQSAFIADELRRAHLVDGVPWGRMAVLVRSPAQTSNGLRRAWATAAVPAVVSGESDPTATALVQAVLAVLRGGIEPASLTADVAAEILQSPLGRLDPLGLRRLRRAVRAAWPGAGPSAELLAEIIRGDRDQPSTIPADLGDCLSRIADLVQAARRRGTAPGAATAAGEPAEDVLWRVWARSGLSRRLEATSRRGGRDGERADAMVDAILALFRVAADLAVRLPGAGVRALLDLVSGQQIPLSAQPGLRPDSARDAVAILSAHAAKGLEWDVVVIADVQQEVWPDVRRRADLLGLQDLLDIADGLVPGLGRTATAVAEERRLFYVATTRARHRLVVTAVEDDEHTPSPFLAELAGPEGVVMGWPRHSGGTPRRGLHLPALLADLRRAVADPSVPQHTRDEAAAALGRLAAAGVRGAHPDEWLGLTDPSTNAPRIPPAGTVTLSPSQVEGILTCPLRSVLTRSGGSSAPTWPQLLGVLVHAVAHGITEDVAQVDLDAAIAGMLAAQEHLPAWERARTGRMLTAMTNAVGCWIDSAREERRLIGSEVEVDVVVPQPEQGAGLADDERAMQPGSAPERRVKLAGRVDWVSRDSQGRVVVTDFKTSASPPSRAEVAAHPQLAAYQVATALGAFGEAQRTGGGELVLLRSGSPRAIAQQPLTPSELEEWTNTLRTVGEAISGATVIAREGAGCERCPVRSSCPLRSEGRQVAQ
jgi:superfamily I DNA/RNA helicase